MMPQQREEIRLLIRKIIENDAATLAKIEELARTRQDGGIKDTKFFPGFEGVSD